MYSNFCVIFIQHWHDECMYKNRTNCILLALKMKTFIKEFWLWEVKVKYFMHVSIFLSSLFSIDTNIHCLGILADAKQMGEWKCIEAPVGLTMLTYPTYSVIFDPKIFAVKESAFYNLQRSIKLCNVQPSTCYGYIIYSFLWYKLGFLFLPGKYA